MSKIDPLDSLFAAHPSVRNTISSLLTMLTFHSLLILIADFFLLVLAAVHVQLGKDSKATATKVKKPKAAAPKKKPVVKKVRPCHVTKYQGLDQSITLLEE